MDPIHHTKIVDKLMQYRGKIPKGGHLSDPESRYNCENMRNQVDDLIILIETMAQLFEKGLVR